MSIEHDITYKWSFGNSTITVTRQVVADLGSALDLAVPNLARNQPASFSLSRAKVQSIFMLSDQPAALKAGGVSAVQQLAVTGTPTGGTFGLTFGGQTTAAVPWNATAAQVQAALVALSSVGAGGVVCTGGPFPGTAVNVAFAGLNAVQVLALITGDPTLLTGGSSPAVTATTTTAGVAPDTTISLLAGVPLVWDSQAYAAQPFAADVATLYLTNTSGSRANFKLRTLSNA